MIKPCENRSHLEIGNQIPENRVQLPENGDWKLENVVKSHKMTAQNAEMQGGSWKMVPRI